MRKEILDRNPGLDIAVTSVWLPVLKTDDKVGADENVSILAESRVRQYYDPDGRTGRWFHQHVVVPDARIATKPLFCHGIAWDAFFLYGPQAKWDDAPETALAAGGPIVKESTILRDAVEHLTGQPRSTGK